MSLSQSGLNWPHSGVSLRSIVIGRHERDPLHSLGVGHWWMDRLTIGQSSNIALSILEFTLAGQVFNKEHRERQEQTIWPQSEIPFVIKFKKVSLI